MSENQLSTSYRRHKVTIKFRCDDFAKLRTRPGGCKEAIRIEHWHIYPEALIGYWDKLSFNPNDSERAPKSAHFYTMYINGCWSIFRQFLKPGDHVDFAFRTNQSQLLNDCGLYHDELIVSVKRNGRTIVRNMVLEDEITMGNTCRAIKF